MPGKSGPLPNVRFFVGKQGRGRPGQQLVADRHAQPVPALRIDHFPAPALVWRAVPAGFGFRAQEGAASVELGAVGVGRSGRQRLNVHLVDCVVFPIEVKVEPEAEQVLVDGRGQVGGDQRRKLGLLSTGLDRAHANDTGQFDLHLNRPVQVQIPVEAVLVVADGEKGTHHQPPRATNLGVEVRGGVDIHMLPQHPVVLLVDAHRVLDRDGLPIMGHGVDIQVANLPQTVAAQLERVGQIAD